MRISKRKNLQKSVDEMQNDLNVAIERISKLEFHILNPPKYDVGDKVGKFMITKREIKTDINFNFLGFRITDDLSWSYDVTNLKTGETGSYYEYSLVSK